MAHPVCLMSFGRRACPLPDLSRAEANPLPRSSNALESLRVVSHAGKADCFRRKRGCRSFIVFQFRQQKCRREVVDQVMRPIHIPDGIRAKLVEADLRKERNRVTRAAKDHVFGILKSDQRPRGA